MSTLQIVLLGLLALGGLLVALALRRRALAAAQIERPSDRLDTLAGWPPRATRLMNTSERRAYAMLSRALPDHLVLAQVQIARFVSVPKRNSYTDWLRRVGYQCVDLLVCDAMSQALIVVELSPAEPSERAKKRLTRMRRTLQSAGLTVHVWQADALPPFDTIRKLVMPEAPPLPEPGAVPRRRFDDEPAQGSEPRDLLEPPPSTWYDELDSQTVPLDKPA